MGFRFLDWLFAELNAGRTYERSLVGNAPCSWGTLEFEETKGRSKSRSTACWMSLPRPATPARNWAIGATCPPILPRCAAKSTAADLVMLGAFVPVALKDRAAHAAGIANAVKTARLLAAVATKPAPYLVLADDNGTVPERTKMAGRVTPEIGLSVAEWKNFAGGANQVARAVFDETGLRTVFHHHCAGYVETPEEIATLLELTDPQRLGLVFDTGHYCYGTGEEDCDAGRGARSLRRPDLVHPFEGY